MGSNSILQPVKLALDTRYVSGDVMLLKLYRSRRLNALVATAIALTPASTLPIPASAPQPSPAAYPTGLRPSPLPAREKASNSSSWVDPLGKGEASQEQQLLECSSSWSTRTTMAGQ